VTASDGGFDRDAYASENRDRRRATEDALRAIDAFTLDEYGRGPAVTLLCPKRHALLPVHVFVEPQDDHLAFEVLPAHEVRESGPVARAAEPWNRAKRTCGKCPKIIDHAGNCADHGGPVEEIGPVRTDFRCTQCGKVYGPVTTVRLLKLYGLALHTGQPGIPIGNVADTPMKR